MITKTAAATVIPIISESRSGLKCLKYLCLLDWKNASFDLTDLLPRFVVMIVLTIFVNCLDLIYLLVVVTSLKLRYDLKYLLVVVTSLKTVMK
jgi:hypothetical protein